MQTEVMARPVQNHIIDYGVTDAALAKLKEKYTGLTCDTKEGYEKTRKAIADIRDRRVAVENRRKELKADSLEYGRKVDREAKRITEALEEIEEPLKAAKKLVDDEAERVRREAEEAERRKAEEEARRIREEQLARERAEREAEEERLRIERERLEAERAELEKARRAEEERQRAERERVEAEQRAERERMEAERRELEAERQRLAQEEAVRQAKIQAEREAAERAERERLAEERRKVEAAELAARLEAMKPDAEKLKSLAEQLRNIAYPEMQTKEAKERLWDVVSAVNSAAELAGKPLE